MRHRGSHIFQTIGLQTAVRMSAYTVLKNISRAGNATCMKRSVQDDMNGPLRVGRPLLPRKTLGTHFC
jgi:hypothetical protein